MRTAATSMTPVLTYQTDVHFFFFKGKMVRCPRPENGVDVSGGLPTHLVMTVARLLPPLVCSTDFQAEWIVQSSHFIGGTSEELAVVLGDVEGGAWGINQTKWRYQRIIHTLCSSLH